MNVGDAPLEQRPDLLPSFDEVVAEYDLPPVRIFAIEDRDWEDPNGSQWLRLFLNTSSIGREGDVSWVFREEMNTRWGRAIWFNDFVQDDERLTIVHFPMKGWKLVQATSDEFAMMVLLRREAIMR